MQKKKPLRERVLRGAVYVLRRARSEGRPSFCKARAASASALGRRSWRLLTGSEVLILGDGCCRGRRSERRGELAPRCSGRSHSAAWLVWFCPVGSVLLVVFGWLGTVGWLRKKRSEFLPLSAGTPTELQKSKKKALRSAASGV